LANIELSPVFKNILPVTKLFDLSLIGHIFVESGDYSIFACPMEQSRSFDSAFGASIYYYTQAKIECDVTSSVYE